jgi:glutathione peroxidase
MKFLGFLLAFVLLAAPASVYDFKLKTLDGDAFSLAKYKGKKILIVNTASKCGYTPQYTDLQKLSELYKDKLVIVGFPANNFANQEPGTVADIKECTAKHNVAFTISEKVSVKGEDIAPLFKYLTETENPDFTGEIKWNFEKFLLDENGKLIHRYRSAVKPLDPVITSKI